MVVLVVEGQQGVLQKGRTARLRANRAAIGTNTTGQRSSSSSSTLAGRTVAATQLQREKTSSSSRYNKAFYGRVCWVHAGPPSLQCETSPGQWERGRLIGVLFPLQLPCTRVFIVTPPPFLFEPLYCSEKERESSGFNLPSTIHHTPGRTQGPLYGD